MYLTNELIHSVRTLRLLVQITSILQGTTAKRSVPKEIKKRYLILEIPEQIRNFLKLKAIICQYIFKFCKFY